MPTHPALMADHVAVIYESVFDDARPIAPTQQIEAFGPGATICSRAEIRGQEAGDVEVSAGPDLQFGECVRE